MSLKKLDTNVDKSYEIQYDLSNEIKFLKTLIEFVEKQRPDYVFYFWHPDGCVFGQYLNEHPELNLGKSNNWYSDIENCLYIFKQMGLDLYHYSYGMALDFYGFVTQNEYKFFDVHNKILSLLDERFPEKIGLPNCDVTAETWLIHANKLLSELE